jgi:RNA polymerase sigma-70 factor (ECF subfamily)
MTQPAGSRSDWIGAALEAHEASLLRYASRLLGDADRARDVVQDTFLRLCREEPPPEGAHLRPWLFTVCRNRVLDLRRKDTRLRWLGTENADGRASSDPTPARVLESAEMLQAVRDVLATLPESQREAIHLKVQEGLSYKEIGIVTGHSVSRVGVLIHDGLKAVRATMRARTAPTPLRRVR